jgi:hypothetical protein
MTAKSGLSANDILRIAGDRATDKIGELLAVNPTFEELKEACVWAGGDGDLLAKQGRALTGKVAILFEILQSDQEDEEP